MRGRGATHQLVVERFCQFKVVASVPRACGFGQLAGFEALLADLANGSTAGSDRVRAPPVTRTPGAPAAQHVPTRQGTGRQEREAADKHRQPFEQLAFVGLGNSARLQPTVRRTVRCAVARASARQARSAPTRPRRAAISRRQRPRPGGRQLDRQRDAVQSLAHEARRRPRRRLPSPGHGRWPRRALHEQRSASEPAPRRDHPGGLTHDSERFAAGRQYRSAGHAPE